MSDDRRAIPVGTVLEIVSEGRQEIARNRARMPDAKSHPVWYALVTEFCRRFELYLAKLAVGVEPSAADSEPVFELRSWIYDLEDRSGEYADSLTKHGMLYTEVTAELKRLEKYDKPGRPAERRQAFVNGYEMKLRGATYPQIVDKFCDCDRGKRIRHDISCRENFRKGIQTARKLLTKYQLSAS